MIFAYIVPILLVVMIYRFWQLKQSIGKDDSYERYLKKHHSKEHPFIGKIKAFFGIKCWWLGLITSIVFSSCRETPPPSTGDYQQGVFCINEGIFGQTSGTISHYSPNEGILTQNIFNAANNRALGNVVQSMTFIEQEAYIIVNNSNKIEIVEAATFIEKSQILGLEQPRYLVANNDKAFVSQWGADGLTGSIATIHLNSGIITSVRPVGKGPEKILLHNDKLYIPNVGGYDVDNRIIIMNPQNDSIIDSILVDDKPSACVADKDDNIWVLCGGKTVYTSYPNIDIAASTESTLIQIDADTDSILFRRTFGKGLPTSNLTIDKDNHQIYYTREGKIWQYDIANNTETAIITGSFYGMDFNPNNGYIYAATNNGIDDAWTKYYQPNGILIDSFRVGVFANGFVFRN